VDIAALISSFSAGTFTVTRTEAASTTKGRKVAGDTSSVTITAAIVPINGEFLERLAEGRDVEKTKVLYTATRLYVGGPGEDYEADKISIGGVTYEVEAVAPWQDGSSSRVGYACVVRAV
jgi:hypothetical protein